MTKGIFDWKTMTLVGLALVAGLLGARSMISGVEGRGDQGFGESTITPLTSDEPTVAPMIWTPPAEPRNPFEMAEGYETPTVIIDDAPDDDPDEENIQVGDTAETAEPDEPAEP